MLRIFRQLRQRLLTDNKFSKYLLYAIGEILLVVIGILIALQVNNWNETQKSRRELTNIIRNIAADIKEDVRHIKFQMEFLNKENRRIKSFLNHQDYSGFTSDSLEQALETFYTQVTWRTNNFDRLVSSDITEYGKYVEVMKGIKEYYELGIPRIKDFEAVLKNAVLESDQFWRFEQNFYEFDYQEGLHSIQSNEEGRLILNTLLKSPIPRNILKINYRQNKNLVSRYNRFTNGLNELVKEIEDALLEANGKSTA